MIRHHSEPGLNILNELRLTLSSPALKNFKASASSAKNSGDFSVLPRLSKNRRHPFDIAKVRFSVRSPKKQPSRRRPRRLFIQRLQGEGMVEPDGIEPTTSCLQSMILAVFDHLKWLFMGLFGVGWQALAGVGKQKPITKL